MSFDTNPTGDGADHAHGSLSIERVVEVIPAVDAIAPRQNFDVLLKLFDADFSRLLAKSRVGFKDDKAVVQVSTCAPALQQGPTAEEIAERDKFLADQGQNLVRAEVATPVSAPETPRGRSPRRGLGPPVVIGFDCEWGYSKPGRNKLLSAQFHLIGPTGERLNKVINVDHGDILAERPSLTEALDELLDEAEAYCIFEDWPVEVILCGFFTRADLPVFRDAKLFIKQLQGLNGTLASVGKPASVQLPLSDERAGRLRSRYAFIVGDDFDPRMLSARLIDARLLAPPGEPLAKIGEWIGLEKLKLPSGYKKSDFERLKRERPDFFRLYGLRDAEIAAIYVLWVIWFCGRHLGLKGLSATASGLGVRLALLCMRRDGVHPDVALNFVQVRRWRWDNRHGTPNSIKKREATEERRWLEAFLSDAFLGGRNECFWFGPTPVDSAATRLYDHDLAGCYVVSLAGVMALAYDQMEIVRNAERYRGHVAGFAKVRFKFPEATLYPCLPVKVGNYGLWFPLSGVSLATAPEIELAMLMGADIEILFGVIIPWMDRAELFERSRKVLRQRIKPKQMNQELVADGDTLVPVEAMQFPPDSHGDVGYRPFESFAIYTRHERLKYRGKTLPNLFMKLLGNACYGKTGQGFKDKRAYGPQEERSVKIGTSSISEAAIAAMTSGFARAVLGEILWKLPSDALVVSATTDGVLVDFEQLDLSGVMCQRFQSLVDRVAPGTAMTELKHLIVQAVAGKTRLQLTGKTVEGKDPVIAKGGIKVLLDAADGDEAQEKVLLSPENQNAYVLDQFIKRWPGQTIKRPSMMSMRDQLPNNWDLQVIENEVKLNMEFDFKRQPVDARMVRIESLGVEHLAFSTLPWKSADEGELIRILFDQWRKGDDSKPGHCLKTMEDWASWQAFQGLYAGNRRRKQRYQEQLEIDQTTQNLLPASIKRGLTGVRYARVGSSYLGIAIRTFLAAYVQKAWGLDINHRLSQSKLAAWLTEQGYSTKVHDIKNAGRSLLQAHTVPATPEVLAFMAIIKHRFPALEVEQFLVPL